MPQHIMFVFNGQLYSTQNKSIYTQLVEYRKLCDQAKKNDLQEKEDIEKIANRIEAIKSWILRCAVRMHSTIVVKEG